MLNNNTQNDKESVLTVSSADSMSEEEEEVGCKMVYKYRRSDRTISNSNKVDDVMSALPTTSQFLLQRMM